MLDVSARKSHLIVHGREPFNAEPRLDRLRREALTPQADFYVRCHGTIPRLDGASHRLVVDGMVTDPLELSVAELRSRFEQRIVTAVLQCAGNRRGDLRAVAPVSGDPWSAGAIGNASWTGVRLADVLAAAGADEEDGLHVAFGSLDECEVDGERFRYGASVPAAKARAPEVLLAWAMNGEPLSPEHGFPLRAVVPGYAGARSPKWLARVTVQPKPSGAKPQERDYKLFLPDITKDTADWTTGVTINDLPVNSAICEPADLAQVKKGRTLVRGWAQASGRPITRVDVTSDGGRTWRQATLEHDEASPWSWTLWSLDVDLPAGTHELAVRAWDGAGQAQPSRPDVVWNFKGYLSAAWHRVRLKVI